MSGLYSWTYSGVNFNIPGSGGADCVGYLNNYQKIAETLIVAIIVLIELRFAIPRLNLKSYSENGCGDSVSEESKSNPSNGFKQFLLVALCMTFGVELGYKFATRQFIWVLNPCHIVTAIQIYLLAANPSKLVSLLFRIQIHLLSGVTIALCLPVVNTRLLPHEVEIYWVQHILLLIVPLYLMSLGGPYTVEHLQDFSWAILVLAIQLCYHFFFLQAISLVTHVNLNNIMCPAVSDPFHGPFYRLMAIVHQSALILIHGKAFVTLASAIGIPVTFSTPLIYKKSQVK